MAEGSGKYDDICTEIRERLKAQGVMICVVGGERGEGFACQADFITMLGLPDALEMVAESIRHDIGLKDKE